MTKDNIAHTIHSFSKEKKGTTFLITTCQKGHGASYCTQKIANDLLKFTRKKFLVCDASPEKFHSISKGDNAHAQFEIVPWEGKERIDTLQSTVLTQSAETNTADFADNLLRIRSNYDIVLVDSSAILHSPGLYSILSVVDSIILVVASNNTRKPVIADTIRGLQGHGGNIIGTILNKRKFYIPQWIYKRFF
jgi:cellulose biosynthesis protein BcsQ